MNVKLEHIWEDANRDLQHGKASILPELGAALASGLSLLTNVYQAVTAGDRYRTGDLPTLNYDDSACGRTMSTDGQRHRYYRPTTALSRLLHPSEIEHVRLDINGVAPYYRIDLYEEDNLDVMELTVERAEGSCKDLGN